MAKGENKSKPTSGAKKGKRNAAKVQKQEIATTVEPEAEPVILAAAEKAAEPEQATTAAVEKPKTAKRASKKTAAKKASQKAAAIEDPAQADAPKARKKPGPKPKTAEQKAEDAAKRAELKKAADNMKPEIILQYQNAEAAVEALVEAAKAQFKAAHKRTPITSLKLYLKPEENAAYYVINEKDTGKVDM